MAAIVSAVRSVRSASALSTRRCSKSLSTVPSAAKNGARVVASSG